MVLLIVALFGLMLAAEVPVLVRQHRRADLWTFLAVWTLSLALGVLQTLDVPLVNPHDLIQAVVSPLTGGGQ